MSLRAFSFLEPLESRIAPATVVHPLPDIFAGAGQTGAVVDLSKIFDANSTGEYANRTLITIKTNFDADPTKDGIQGDITIELYDDLAPLTVQNFLRHALNRNADGDFDGTFFHRLAQGFVLQGGGFQLDGKKVEHIDTFDPVHNEFDPSRSNVRGTIALAKTGLGPNTGTSEWFINLADNSGNLDNQNGGFTVFGRVINKPGEVDGMEVIDKIAQLSTITGVVGDFPTPVQNNYDPDPDNNPSTPAPAPTNANLIVINDVVVTHSNGGVPPGAAVSYSVTTNSNLLTTSLDGSNLNLKFVPGKTGVAEVAVKVTIDGVEHIETFNVAVQPNLTAEFVSSTLPGSLIPGDEAKVKLNIINTGGGVAKGLVDVKFYFAKAVRNQFTGVYETVEPRVPVDAGGQAISVNIGSGKTATVTAKVQVPDNLVSDQDTVYHLYAVVTPKAGSFNSEELRGYTDDNTTLQPGGLHQIFNAFGNIGKRNVPLTFVDADGDVVTLKLKGKGFGQVFKNTNGTPDDASDDTFDLLINGTQANTQIQALVNSASGNGEFSFRHIDALTPVSSVKFGKIDISGNVAFTNGVKLLQLEDITGPSTMSIGLIPGAENAKTTLSFGKISDLILDSTMPITSLRAAEWLDKIGSHDSLTATGLQTLKIGTPTTRGDFQANIDLTSSAAVKSFTVHGLVENSTIRISGNVGSVQLDGIKNSNFLVGANERPESLEDFTEFRTVGRFTITNALGNSDLFVNSTVAAATFGNVVIRGVDADSSSNTFGVVAEAIKNYNRVGVTTLTNLDAPRSADEDQQYEVTIL